MGFTQLLGAVIMPLGSKSCDAWRRAGYDQISSRAATSARFPVGGSLHIVAGEVPFPKGTLFRFFQARKQCGTANRLICSSTLLFLLYFQFIFPNSYYL